MPTTAIHPRHRSHHPSLFLIGLLLLLLPLLLGAV